MYSTVLNCTTVLCAVLHWYCTVLCTVLYCTATGIVLYCTALLHCTVYSTVLYCTVLVLYCTALYCVQYCAVLVLVLYCAVCCTGTGIVLYYTALCKRLLSFHLLSIHLKCNYFVFNPYPAGTKIDQALYCWLTTFKFSS